MQPNTQCEKTDFSVTNIQNSVLISLWGSMIHTFVKIPCFDICEKMGDGRFKGPSKEI